MPPYPMSPKPSPVSGKCRPGLTLRMHDEAVCHSDLTVNEIILFQWGGDGEMHVPGCALGSTYTHTFNIHRISCELPFHFHLIFHSCVRFGPDCQLPPAVPACLPYHQNHMYIYIYICIYINTSTNDDCCESLNESKPRSSRSPTTLAYEMAVKPKGEVPVIPQVRSTEGPFGIRQSSKTFPFTPPHNAICSPPRQPNYIDMHPPKLWGHQASRFVR